MPTGDQTTAADTNNASGDKEKINEGNGNAPCEIGAVPLSTRNGSQDAPNGSRDNTNAALTELQAGGWDNENSSRDGNNDDNKGEDDKPMSMRGGGNYGGVESYPLS